jgi:hypothetical protein
MSRVLLPYTFLLFLIYFCLSCSLHKCAFVLMSPKGRKRRLRMLIPHLLRSKPGCRLETNGFDKDHLHMVMIIKLPTTASRI